MAAGLPIQSVYYPESDGKPMGETDWHRNAIVRLIELLQSHFAGRKVYVSGDLLDLLRARPSEEVRGSRRVRSERSAAEGATNL